MQPCSSEAEAVHPAADLNMQTLVLFVSKSNTPDDVRFERDRVPTLAATHTIFHPLLPHKCCKFTIITLN